MIGSIPAIHALGGGPLRLIAAGGLFAPAAFARASSGLSTAADGTTWQAAASDAPRFHGTLRRLLLEGARTNSVTNPRGEGAAPATLPTGFTLTTPVSGMTVDCLGAAAEAGMTGFDLRVQGTLASATVVTRVNLPTAAFSIPASGMAVASVFCRVVSGTAMATPSFRSTGAGVTAVSTAAPGAALSRLAARFDYASAVTGTALGFNLNYAAGTIDSTIRLLWPQFEANAAFASSPVLPAAGTPAAATRAPDAPNLALTAAQGGRGTLVGTFMLPQAAPAGVEQGLLQLDDGSDANRVVLRNAAGGGAVEAVIVAGGAVAATLAGGGVTAGAPFRAALGWGPGGVALCLAGGTVTSTATLPAGLARLVVGHANAALTRACFGEVGALDLHSSRLPDTGLQAITAA